MCGTSRRNNANNKFKGQFIYENLTIQNNLIHAAKINKISNLVFLGSSCVYPKYCKQPIKEEYLLSGNLEKTNEPYAVAKLLELNYVNHTIFNIKQIINV